MVDCLKRKAKRMTDNNWTSADDLAMKLDVALDKLLEELGIGGEDD
jgi:hypothetical protein